MTAEEIAASAAELTREVVEDFERLTGGRLVEGYGLTEASPLVAANPLWEGGVRKRTVTGRSAKAERCGGCCCMPLWRSMPAMVA